MACYGSVCGKFDKFDKSLKPGVGGADIGLSLLNESNNFVFFSSLN